MTAGQAGQIVVAAVLLVLGSAIVASFLGRRLRAMDPDNRKDQ